jgi:hypothetical protein
VALVRTLEFRAKDRTLPKNFLDEREGPRHESAASSSWSTRQRDSDSSVNPI